MRERAASIFKIHPGEGGLLASLAAMMLLIAAGSAIGGASIDALFFARVGVSNLPAWFIIMGFINLLNLMLVTGLVRRLDRARLYRSLPFFLAVGLALARLLLAFRLHWIYPVLYIGEGVINSLQSVFLWGLAGSLLNTRQAKRLFPLFSSGSIAGSMLGSFSTPLLVRWFGAEAMPLVWSLGLFVTWVLCARLVQRNRVKLAAISLASRRHALERPLPAGNGERTLPESHPKRAKAKSQNNPLRQPGMTAAGSRPRTRTRPSAKLTATPTATLTAIFGEIRAGYAYVRRTPLLRWLSFGNVLFSVLWFFLYLPFSRLSAGQFPDANRLASFFGLFQGVCTGAALLISLFMTSRLFNLMGVMNTLVVYPLIYLVGFSTLAIFPVFPAVVISRFAQLSWAQGIAEPAWQASLNAVPAERRDQARSVINALPGQAGVILSGLILFIGQQLLQPQQLFMLGAVAAALCSWAMWQSKKAYRQALTAALQSGQPQVFYSEEEPFGGLQRDPAAQNVLLAGLSSPDARTRRLSAEILGHIPSPTTRQALLNGLHDPEADVRTACLAALPGAYSQTDQPGEVELAILTDCLDDPQPAVRSQAVQTLQLLAGLSPQTQARFTLLLDDPYPTVQVHAALALMKTGQAAPAIRTLRTLAGSSNPEIRRQAVAALSAACQDPAVGAQMPWDILLDSLDDPFPEVRRAALQGIGSSLPQGFLPRLVKSLGDDNPAVRALAAAAFGQIGAPALPLLLKALDQPGLERGVLPALEYFIDTPIENELRAYIARKTSAALSDEAHARSWLSPVSERKSLLVDSLRLRARRQAVLALHAFKLLNRKSLNSKENLESIDLVLDSLQSRDPDLSAFAMESLETSDDSQLIRPLINLWDGDNPASENSASEKSARRAPAHPAQDLFVLLEDPDAWLRACAILAALDEPALEFRSRLRSLLETDPDEWVRQTAGQALSIGENMDTLPTLTAMERILFLRKVPLFSGLEPEELKQVAEISLERYYTDGELIARQGDPGDDLYIIVSGSVRVQTDTGLELAMRISGEYVGEMAVLDKLPRMASLSASGDTRLLCINQKDFETILQQRPALCLDVIHVLSERLRKSRPEGTH